MRHVRPIKIEGHLAFVTLTKGYVATIDAEDVPLISGVNWCASVEKHTVYAMRKMRIDGSSRTVKMHRIIMGAAPSQFVDHRDGDGLNNRRDNLRFSTWSQNMWNRRAPRKSKSGLLGAHWNTKSQKWESYIEVNGVRHRLGKFNCPKKAHEAYVQAARSMHGEFSAV